MKLDASNISLERLVADIATSMETLMPRKAGMTASKWISSYTFDPKYTQKNFNFDVFSFQPGILDEKANIVYIKKSAQLGITECFCRWGLWFIATHQKPTIIYTMPTMTDISSFSAHRFMPILQAIEMKIPMLEEVNNAMQKKILGGFIYFKGTKGTSSAISIPADALIHDEYDFSDINTITQYNSRLENSPHKKKRIFSTPTFTDAGIDELFKKGSQAHFLHKCPKCGHYNNLHYSDIINLNPLRLISETFVCKKCDRPLDKMKTKTRWVHKFPDREEKSYFISQVQAPHKSPTMIFDSLKQYSHNLQEGINFVLGETYDSPKNPFTYKSLLEATGTHTSKDKSYLTSIGVDTGEYCHICVTEQSGDHIYIIHQEEVPSKRAKNTLANLCDRFNPIQINIDAMPLMVFNEEVRDNIFTETYDIWLRSIITNFRVDPEKKAMTVLRFYMIDKVSNMLKNKELIINADAPKDFYEHFLNEVFKDGDFINKPNKPDHYLFATGFSVLTWLTKQKNLSMFDVTGFNTKI